jgi:DNA-binding transcriptional LysR family regulator
MDVKQLEYFRAIVDAGTISGAARVLHMTQPPLSYQVKMLEEELQVQLFLRGTKKITLTEAGKTGRAVFLPWRILPSGKS